MSQDAQFLCTVLRGGGGGGGLGGGGGRPTLGNTQDISKKIVLRDVKKMPQCPSLQLHYCRRRTGPPLKDLDREFGRKDDKTNSSSSTLGIARII